MYFNFLNIFQPNSLKNNSYAPINTSNKTVIDHVIEESLCQVKKTSRIAHQSFLLAMIMTGTSAIIGFVGVGFLLLGKASGGTITTASGLVSSMVFIQLAKDASNRLDKANERLDAIILKVENFNKK